MIPEYDIPPECEHPNIICERDGEFHKEHCPDCGYSREWDETKSEKLTLRPLYVR